MVWVYFAKYINTYLQSHFWLHVWRFKWISYIIYEKSIVCFKWLPGMNTHIYYEDKSMLMICTKYRYLKVLACKQKVRSFRRVTFAAQLGNENVADSAWSLTVMLIAIYNWLLQEAIIASFVFHNCECYEINRLFALNGYQEWIHNNIMQTKSMLMIFT
jgi:hypothetical protein